MPSTIHVEVFPEGVTVKRINNQPKIDLMYGVMVHLADDMKGGYQVISLLINDGCEWNHYATVFPPNMPNPNMNGVSSGLLTAILEHSASISWHTSLLKAELEMIKLAQDWMY